MSIPNPSAPLPFGEVAPDFWLQDAHGEVVKRHQFRNRAALIVILLTPSPAAAHYLERLASHQAAYQELNVQPIAILRATRDALNAEAALAALPTSILRLADPHGKAWHAYTADAPQGDAAAVFVLDLYGGVEGQRVVASVADLPDPATLIDWARGAQYRCSI